MGLLRNFDLSNFENAKCVMETGSEKGFGIEHALKYKNIKEVHSVEINEKFYDFCGQKFKHDDRVKLWLGSSENRLKEMLESISHLDSCLYWLDAHLPSDPGSYFKHDRVDNDVEFPLEIEMKIIKENRDTSKDYFIIDDLRIYIDGPFQHTGKSWPHHHLYPNFFPHKDGISFIEDLFGDSHEIVKIYDHEGYLLLYPKEVE
tara:strand:- start:11764 stop:12372 length:609 start_codon:yes stop_codon:yes gene_type:complete